MLKKVVDDSSARLLGDRSIVAPAAGGPDTSGKRQFGDIVNWVDHAFMFKADTTIVATQYLYTNNQVQPCSFSHGG